MTTLDLGLLTIHTICIKYLLELLTIVGRTQHSITIGYQQVLTIVSPFDSSDPSFYHVSKALAGYGKPNTILTRDVSSHRVEGVDATRSLLLLGGEALKLATGLTDAPSIFGACWSASEARAIATSTMGQANFLEGFPSLEKVTACLHPVDIRAARWALPTLKEVVARAASSSRPLADRLAGISINLSPTLSDLEEALNASPLVSIDVETPRNNPRRLLLVGCAPTPDRAVVCEWREPYQQRISSFLGDKSRAIVGHNFYYDYGSFAANGVITAAKVYDTITAERRRYSSQPDRKQEAEEGENGEKAKKFKIKWFSLQNCILRNFDGEAPWKRVGELGWVQAYYRAAFPGYSEWEYDKFYCCLDVLQTRRLIEHQRTRMERL